ncbi:MAG: hypothetical protein ACXWCV_08030 [Caldimonas sp.]
MAEPRNRRPWLARLGQGLLYAVFAALIGVFSHWPAYHHLAPDQALIKLSFSHHGQRVAACRQLGAAELAKLPPNMRAPTQCPRERAPVVVELDIDGRNVVHQVAAPSGLSKDGASSVYRRVQVVAGEHRIAVRLKDGPTGNAFDYERAATVQLAPAHILVIDFDAEKGGIVWQ